MEATDEIEQMQRRRKSATDHVWHTWINRRSNELRNANGPWPRSQYEFKSMLSELRRAPALIRRARDGQLRTEHQQCSHSPVEPIANNVLRCALGVDVAQCPILASLYATFAERASDPYYGCITDADVDQVAGNTCCWHIYDNAENIDTSEGYFLDESDRRFWANIYESMAMGDDTPPYDAAIAEHAAQADLADAAEGCESC